MDDWDSNQIKKPHCSFWGIRIQLNTLRSKQNGYHFAHDIVTQMDLLAWKLLRFDSNRTQSINIFLVFDVGTAATTQLTAPWRMSKGLDAS